MTPWWDWNFLLPFVFIWLFRIDKRIVRLETLMKILTNIECDDKGNCAELSTPDPFDPKE